MYNKYDIWNEPYKVEQQVELKKTLKRIGSEVYDFFTENCNENGLRFRLGQSEMACEIVDAMMSDKHFLCEAGVGIGKTYAYLTPLIMYWKKYREPIVIATSTIALQEQLNKDIEKLENIFGVDGEILLIKGQMHYLCKDRLGEIIGRCNNKDKEMLEQIDQGGSQRGDWTFEIPEDLWNELNVKNYNPKKCDKCVHRSYCYYYGLRREVIRTKGFIICNQDLLISDLKRRSKKYGNEYTIFTNRYKYVVIDEAHNIEEKVRNAYTVSISYRDIVNGMEQLRRQCVRSEYAIDNAVDKYIDLVDKMFAYLLEDIQRQDLLSVSNHADIEKYEIPRKEPGMLNSIKKLYEDIYRRAETIAVFAKNSNTIDDILSDIEEQEELWGAFSSNNKYVFWMTSEKKSKSDITVSYCPIEMAEYVNKLFFDDEIIRTIMTSATLTTSNTGIVRDDYDYFIKTTSLPVEMCLLSEPKSSPFDYNRNAIVYYTNNSINPSDNRELFIEQSIEEIINILDITKGKALILFTAKSDMNDVYESLKKRNVPYTLIIQDDKLPQSEAISRFKRDINSVLLGTGTYWEGVNVEGTALSCLIIFRLPFHVPDPIYESKERNTDNKLMNIYVPEMILKLKQGIGRLIRNENDIGIVSILDARISDNSRAKYKNNIWDSIPIKNKTSDLNEVRKFYKNVLKTREVP